MSSKRVVMVFSGFCLGAGVFAYWQQREDIPRRLRARHVRETVVVSAGYRRLAGLFDGITPDPNF
jgi:hypothetical protein